VEILFLEQVTFQMETIERVAVSRLRANLLALRIEYVFEWLGKELLCLTFLPGGGTDERYCPLESLVLLRLH
jgi:hypothetical protein